MTFAAICVSRFFLLFYEEAFIIRKNSSYSLTPNTHCLECTDGLKDRKPREDCPVSKTGSKRKLPYMLQVQRNLIQHRHRRHYVVDVSLTQLRINNLTRPEIFLRLENQQPQCFVYHALDQSSLHLQGSNPSVTGYKIVHEMQDPWRHGQTPFLNLNGWCKDVCISPLREVAVPAPAS